ncbi:uncharacterized protein LOC108679245 [Hyalella azteca]|uniref:Uncharacterized protein LOC108679245 n=1 Tax=Hyalella azteca TaxID=294128 RepID=A0A8B7PB72_HYAAZ|nr:uncharacterized protein LOC108679245 [Hyalella azteca]XP_018023341.1 uncharacterized protein LOC108679245 [Hyalella azteca]
MTETSSVTSSNYAQDMFSPIQFCEVVQEGSQLHLQQHQHPQQYPLQLSVTNTSSSNVTATSNMMISTMTSTGQTIQQQQPQKSPQEQQQQLLQHMPQQSQQILLSPQKAPTFTSTSLLATSTLPLPTPPHHMSPSSSALAPSPLHHHPHHLHQLHLHHHHHLQQHHQHQLQPMQPHQVHPHHHHHHIHPHHLYPHQHQLQIHQQQQQHMHHHHHHQQHLHQAQHLQQQQHQQQQQHIIPQPGLQQAMLPPPHVPLVPLKTKSNSRQSKPKQSRAAQSRNTGNASKSNGTSISKDAKSKHSQNEQPLKITDKCSSTNNFVHANQQSVKTDMGAQVSSDAQSKKPKHLNTESPDVIKHCAADKRSSITAMGGTTKKCVTTTTNSSGNCSYETEKYDGSSKEEMKKDIQLLKTEAELSGTGVLVTSESDTKQSSVKAEVKTKFPASVDNEQIIEDACETANTNTINDKLHTVSICTTVSNSSCSNTTANSTGRSKAPSSTSELSLPGHKMEASSSVPLILSAQVPPLQLLTPSTSSLQQMSSSDLATVQDSVPPILHQPSLVTLQLPTSEHAIPAASAGMEHGSITTTLGESYKIGKTEYTTQSILQSPSKILFLQPSMKALPESSSVFITSTKSIPFVHQNNDVASPASVAVSYPDSISKLNASVPTPITSHVNLPAFICPEVPVSNSNYSKGNESSNANSFSQIKEVECSQIKTSPGDEINVTSKSTDVVSSEAADSTVALKRKPSKPKVATRSVCIGTDTEPDFPCNPYELSPPHLRVSVSTNTSPPESPALITDICPNVENLSDGYHSLSPKTEFPSKNLDENVVHSPSALEMDECKPSSTISNDSKTLFSEDFKPSFAGKVSIFSEEHSTNRFQTSDLTSDKQTPTLMDESLTGIKINNMSNCEVRDVEELKEFCDTEISHMSPSVVSCHSDSSSSLSDDSAVHDCELQLPDEPDSTFDTYPTVEVPPDSSARSNLQNEVSNKDDEVMVIAMTPGHAAQGVDKAPVKRTWRRPWKKKKEREKKKKPARKVRRSKPRRRATYHRTQVIHIDVRNGPPIDTTKTIVSRQSEDHIDSLKQKRQRIKLNRNSGREYVNRLGKIVQARKVGKPCNCPMKCWDRMGSKVVVIFNNFWDLCDFNLQNSYLFTCLKLCDVKRRYTKKPAEESRRQNTFEYFVRISGKHVRVCKRAFMSAHGLTSDKRLRTLLSQMKDGALLPIYDRRGKHLRPMKPSGNLDSSSPTASTSSFSSPLHQTSTTGPVSSTSVAASKKRTRVSPSSGSGSNNSGKKKPQNASTGRNHLGNLGLANSKSGVYPPPPPTSMVPLHGVVPHCSVPSPLGSMTTATPTVSGAVLHPSAAPGHGNAMQEPPHSYIPNGEIYFASHYLDPSQGMTHINQITPQCQKMLESPAYFMAGMKENTFHQ